MRATRWSDNDKNLGPFTYGYSESYRSVAMEIGSDVHEDSDCGTTSMRITLGRHTLICTLPWRLIKPHIERHYLDWDQDTTKRLGRNWYDTTDPRKFGFSFSGAGTIGGATFLHVHRGRSTHDSSTDQSWGCFLPWTDWRHVRRSFYGLHGEHFWTEVDAETKAVNRLGDKVRQERYEIVRSWEQMCPKVKFLLWDYDGAEITATTKIEEREWRFGTGWFEWLSWFRRPMIKRSLDIEFSDEVGPEKGSWKGGIMGHSIEMLPGELHEEAFRRYCEQEHRARGDRTFRIAYIGRV